MCSTNSAPEFRWLHEHTRVLVLVNGFLKMTKLMRCVGFFCVLISDPPPRRTFHELKEALLDSSSAELNQLIATLHFTPEFLSSDATQREQVLAQFWATRKGLVRHNTAAPGSAVDFVGVIAMLQGNRVH
jgi:hypothetical protein